MARITDRFGISYTVARAPLAANAVAYYAYVGNTPIARAVLRLDRGYVSHALVYRKEDRRRGIASALYELIETDLGRPFGSEPTSPFALGRGWPASARVVSRPALTSC